MKKLFTLSLLVLATTLCWAGQKIDAGYFYFVVPDGYNFKSSQLSQDLNMYTALDFNEDNAILIMASNKFQEFNDDDMYKKFIKKVNNEFDQYEFLHEYYDKIDNNKCRHTEIKVKDNDNIVYEDVIIVKDNYSDHYMILCIFAPDRVTLMDNVKKFINNINFY